MARSTDYLALDDDALLKHCEVDFYRSQGPGGQKRNKTSSAVRIRHGATGLIVTASEDRSQHVNKRRALRRIREAIALNVRSRLDLSAYAPSGVLRPYVDKNGHIAINRKNEDYPRVIREVLDVFAASEMQAAKTAAMLGLTTSQFVSFLKNDDRLWGRANQMRTAAGLKSLK
jgi:hypothetical protein